MIPVISPTPRLVVNGLPAKVAKPEYPPPLVPIHRHDAGIELPQHIVATADPKEALSDATFVIHAVPVQYTRKFLENVSPAHVGGCVESALGGEQR